jgi:hypothetical protein
MGATGGVSEPILYSVTASRLLPLLLLLGCLALALFLGRRLTRWRKTQAGPAPRWRWPIGVGLLLVGGLGLWALVQIASPPVLLKATERGLTSYMTGENPSHGVRLQLARHADSEGLFIPWRAMESLTLETVGCYDGRTVRNCEVLAIGLRPGFQELRTGGVVVAPGGWRSTLDLPVPVPQDAEALLVQLRTLQRRYAVR